jgi:hypothetical protein
MPAMSDKHASDAPGHADAVTHHTTDDHGDDHGHDDHAHGDGAEALGPIDVFAWGAGVLGVVAALVIVGGFIIATGG